MTKNTEDTKAGSWRIVLAESGVPEPRFVLSSERGQYNLMSESKYKTEKKASLALALLTRPTQLTHQERVELLALLEG